MKIIKKNYNINIENKKSKTFKSIFDGLSYAIFDIETTGLSALKDNVILCGIIVFESNKQTLYQFFAENISDEKDILTETAKILNKVDFIITYNGKSFDLPFLEKRCNEYDILLSKKYNLDLYILARNYTDMSNFLPNLKQKTVEKFICPKYVREDEISGKDSVNLYKDYIKTKNLDLEKLILLHNYEDICQLQQLIAITRISNFYHYIFDYGFPYKNKENNIVLVEKINLTKTHFRLIGNMKLKENYIIYPSLDLDLNASFNKDNSTFDLNLKVDTEISNYKILDISTLLSSPQKDELNQLPKVSSDYLILSYKKEVYYMEIIFFTKAFINNGFSLNIY